MLKSNLSVSQASTVKYSFDRAEEMQVGAPRGAERWYLRDGVMNDLFQGCTLGMRFGEEFGFLGFGKWQ